MLQFYKANTEQNYHFVANLTPRDVQFNNFMEEFADLEKIKKITIRFIRH